MGVSTQHNFERNICPDMPTHFRSKVRWILLAVIGLVPLIATALGMLYQPAGPGLLETLTLQMIPRFARAALDVIGAVLIGFAVYRLAGQSSKPTSIGRRPSVTRPPSAKSTNRDDPFQY